MSELSREEIEILILESALSSAKEAHARRQRELNRAEEEVRSAAKSVLEIKCAIQAKRDEFLRRAT